MLPVPGDQLSTWPVSLRSGKASTVTRAGWPTRMLVIWVSLKFASAQMFGNGSDGDHLRADVDELAKPHLPLADKAISGRQNSRVAQIVRSKSDLSFRRMDLGAKLLLLDIDRRQRRFLLIKLRQVQAPLRDRFRRIGVGLLDQLLRAGDAGFVQVALALSSS